MTEFEPWRGPFGPRFIAALVALVMITIGVWHLEWERAGLVIEPLAVGATPATVYRRIGAGKAPTVIIAHGFAGSRQFMEAFALTLAHAGYNAVAFDFEGHGRNPTPMSGDVTRVDGTTRRLMAEIGRVTQAALAMPFADGRVALLGHSMASDLVIRQSLEDARVTATVAVSAFSKAVTQSQPANLLIISGAWEGFLRTEALRAVRLTDPSVGEGETIGDPTLGTGRRVAVAPAVEHVGVLYSATSLREARGWLDAVFGRASGGPVSATGGWIAMVLAGIVLLAWPLSSLLPGTGGDRLSAPSLRTTLVAALVPAVVTPLILSVVNTRFLPVLVADYLAAHLLVFGGLSLWILRVRGTRIGQVGWVAALLFAAFGIFVFGGALDRYVASFMPHVGRLPIILAIVAGAVPFMLADCLATSFGPTRWQRVLVFRGAFLASLGLAVALNFERLFFLLIILPVIVLFYAVFGSMGGMVGRATRSPAAAGIGLGLILAWALGVTFPMFSSG